MFVYPLVLAMQGVANAVGAALGTVGGSSDRIVNLAPIREKLMASDKSLDQENGAKRAREWALERGRELAIEEVRNKGTVLPRTLLYTHAFIKLNLKRMLQAPRTDTHVLLFEYVRLL